MILDILCYGLRPPFPPLWNIFFVQPKVMFKNFKNFIEHGFRQLLAKWHQKSSCFKHEEYSIGAPQFMFHSLNLLLDCGWENDRNAAAFN